ncbi:MAG TPA: ribose-5-phosphate isomerase RpiA [Ignavibacteriaceae bacterium]|jgi:ribose 5-phosphate isomerase A
MIEKKIAAESALDFIEEGMIVGLGTGSTVRFFINALAPKIKSGLKITCVSTSQKTSELANSLGIELTDLTEVPEIDLTIDGADEVDKNLNGIKGGGGALLFEKIVASYSKRNIWIVDSTKIVDTLGKFPLPVEVIKFGSDHLLDKFKKLDFRPKFRMDKGSRLISDSDNYIIDLNFGEITEPEVIEMELKSFPGVVETGLFIGVVDAVIVGNKDGAEILERSLK